MSAVGGRGCTEQSVDISFLFSVAAAGQTVPRAPTAWAPLFLCFLSGIGREVGPRVEEQAARVKCCLRGPTVMDPTPWPRGPESENSKSGRRARGTPDSPPTSETEVLCFLSCQAAFHNWWFWNRASSRQGKIWECVPGSPEEKPFHRGPESPVQVPDREGRPGTSAAQGSWNPGASPVRIVSLSFPCQFLFFSCSCFAVPFLTFELSVSPSTTSKWALCFHLKDFFSPLHSSYTM